MSNVAVGLTRQMARCLRAIETIAKKEGRSPSYDELGAFLGLSSKNGVWRLVNSLEQRGYIERRRNCARSLQVIRKPTVYVAYSMAELSLMKSEIEAEILSRLNAEKRGRWP